MAAGNCRWKADGKRKLISIYTSHGHIHKFCSIRAKHDIEHRYAQQRVSGQVLSADGRPVGKALVMMTDSSGETRYAMTNPFGFYRFMGIPAGETYIFLLHTRAIGSRRNLFLSSKNAMT